MWKGATGEAGGGREQGAELIEFVSDLKAVCPGACVFFHLGLLKVTLKNVLVFRRSLAELMASCK